MIVPMNMQRKLLLLLMILLTCSLSLHAEETLSEEALRGEHLTIRLMTLGQGDPLYIWYGHVGIIVDDTLTDRSLMFDFGVFNFKQDNFYLNFSMGRLFYQVMASYAEQRIDYAVDSKRNTSMITLDLPPESRYKIYTALIDHIQPENRTYLYHHYYNNCSTKIRDIIDMGVDGQLKQWSEDIPSQYSYREHIRRYSGNSLIMDFILNFLQSSVIDTPISVWDEMFLPDRMERALMRFSYTDESGVSRPIVSEREILSDFEDRPEIPDLWTPKWPWALALGSLIGIFGILLRYLVDMKDLNFIKILLGAYHTVLALFGGLLGTVLLFMMLFTDHDVTFGNVNLLLLNPLLLYAALKGILLIFGKQKNRHIRDIDNLWAIMSLLSLTLLFLKFFSIIVQQNQMSIALIVPINFALGIYPLIRRRRDRKSTEEER